METTVVLKEEQSMYDGGDAAKASARLGAAVAAPVHAKKVRFGQARVALDRCAASLFQIEQKLLVLQSVGPSRAQAYRTQEQIPHSLRRVEDLASIVTDPELKSKVEQFRTRMANLQICLDASEWDSDQPPWNAGADESPLVSPVLKSAGTDRVESSFAKLHPFLNVLIGVEELSIDTQSNLINFLFFTVTLQKAAGFYGMSRETVFQFIYPLCRGCLAKMLSEVLAGGGSLRDLRARVLRERLSAVDKSNLISQYFYRVQRQGEALADYIREVLTAAVAFDLGLAEQEVVLHILQGIKPEDRSRVLFADKPATYRDLEYLVTLVERAKQPDQRRGCEGAFRPVFRRAI